MGEVEKQEQMYRNRCVVSVCPDKDFGPISSSRAEQRVRWHVHGLLHFQKVMRWLDMEHRLAMSIRK